MPIDDLPRLGLGTWQMTDLETCAENVHRALDVGYRHIDTAAVYGTEEGVGEGIRRSDISREELFLATKIVHHDVPGPEYDDVIQAGYDSLQRLGVDSVELLYIHWPTGIYEPDVVLPAFDELYDEGVFDYVGLSNFLPHQIDEAIQKLDAPILAYQREMHPLQQQDELLELARKNGHWLVAYSPLAMGELFNDPLLQEIAEKYDASIPVISIAWLLSKENVAAIPKASGPHIDENYEALNLELTEEDLERIDNIGRKHRTTDHEWAPWN